MKCFLAFMFCFLFSVLSFATASIANILSLNTATTNVTTSAFVQISSSTPIPASQLVIVNNTSSILIIGTGASGSEVGLVAVLPTSQLALQLGTTLASGTRISVEALDATASTKYISVSLIP